jgi:thiamine kinase-like enzyme
MCKRRNAMGKEQEKQIIRFCEAFDLGDVINKPIEVKGGLLHKLYKVTTNREVYAIKCLNPSIMKRECVLNNMINSEKISALLGSRVPAIMAIEINGNHVHIFEEEYFMIFHWLDGKSIFPPDIKGEHCNAIGNVLGLIHNLNIAVPGIVLESEDSQLFEWEKYLIAGKIEKPVWFSNYEQAFGDIMSWNHKVLKAQSYISKEKVISHRDLDPKNVMWYGNNPYLIDWEAAGYINPYQELLEVLNYWADDGYGNLNKDYFMTLLKTYKKHKNVNEVNWNAVLDSGYEGMLGWLEYSLKRALGIEISSEEDIKMGEEQVIRTIMELKQYQEKVEIIREWLKIE